MENKFFFLSVDYQKIIGEKKWQLKIFFYNDLKIYKTLKEIFELCYGSTASLNEKEIRSAFNISSIVNRDWLEYNSFGLKPIKILNFYIYDDDYYHLKKQPLLPIRIKSTLAFGSGYHETTRTCIEALNHIIKYKKKLNVLDYGCGTGILGISIKKKFPSIKVNFVDIDKIAIKITKTNLKKNNMCRDVNVYFNKFNYQKHFNRSEFDIIVANILFKPLKNLINHFRYISKKKSYIIVSGILQNQSKNLINKYRFFNFFPYKYYNINNWITIIFKNKK